MKKSKPNQRDIKLKDGLAEFVSFYNRFKQITKDTGQEPSDFSYQQTAFIEDLRDYWPKLQGLAETLRIPFHCPFRFIEKVIRRDFITVSGGGGTMVTIVRPDGDLDSLMICGFQTHGSFFAHSLVEQRLQPERELDRIMAKLRKSLGKKYKSILEDKSQHPKEKAASHSPDFRSVDWFGAEYSFTPNQATAVKILWDNWENKTPEVGGDLLAVEADSDSKRPRDIFKHNPAFGTMIQPGKTKGSFRLVEPDK